MKVRRITKEEGKRVNIPVSRTFINPAVLEE